MDRSAGGCLEDIPQPRWLERELQSKLDESRVVHGAGYLSEGAAAQGCTRWPILGVVEHVKKFRPELDVELFIWPEVRPLEQREVESGNPILA